MKKLLLLVLMCMTVRLSAYQMVKPYVSDVVNKVITGTTSAFTIYADIYSADTDSCTFKVCKSSINVIFSSNTAGTLNTEASYWFDVTKTTSDTIGELIDTLNLNTKLHAVKVDGCYLGTCSTGTSISRSSTGGYSDGLAWATFAGKSYGDILLSTNAATILLSAVNTLATYWYKANERICISEIGATNNQESTMTISEGDAVTTINTALNIPVKTQYFNYGDITPMKTSAEGKALEFKVVFSTWVNTNDKIRVKKYSVTE